MYVDTVVPELLWQRPCAHVEYGEMVKVRANKMRLDSKGKEKRKEGSEEAVEGGIWGVGRNWTVFGRRGAHERILPFAAFLNGEMARTWLSNVEFDDQNRKTDM